MSQRCCPYCGSLFRYDTYCGRCQSFICCCMRLTGGIYSQCGTCTALEMKGFNPLLVVVTGSRDWDDYARIRDRLAKLPRGLTVAEGGQRGADQLAKEACLEVGLTCRTIQADWKRLGKRAGPVRNRAMLDLRPGLVLAFPLPHSRGTLDCVKEARRRGIPVEVDPAGTLLCPYCGSAAVLKDSAAVYGEPWGMMWVCGRYPACDAYVGAHKGSNRPLGTLANKALRESRRVAHGVFDPLWKSGAMSRDQAYAWLSAQLGVPPEKCHIAMFTEEQCRRVVEVTSRYAAAGVRP